MKKNSNFSAQLNFCICNLKIYQNSILNHYQIVFTAYNTLLILNLMQSPCLTNNKDASKFYQQINFKFSSQKPSRSSVKIY